MDWIKTQTTLPTPGTIVFCKIKTKNSIHFEDLKWDGSRWLKLRNLKWIPCIGIKVICWTPIKY